MSFKNNKKLQIKKQNQDEDIFKDFLREYNYEYLKILEKGDSSLVVVAFSQKLNCQVAVKIIKIRNGINQVNLQQLDKESEILKNLLNEKYVLQIIEKIEDYRLGLFAIVMELCECNLSTIFQLNTLSIKQIYAMTYQLLYGLKIYQEYGLIYSQIQPSSILFSKTKNAFLIAHYGFFKTLKNSYSQKNYTILNDNLCEMSSEIANQQKLKNQQADVFSLGLILTEAFIQRQLTPKEQKDLKTQSLFTVFPFLKIYENIRFIDNVLQKMINPDTELLPKDLLQTLNAFDVQDNYLSRFKLKKQLRKLYVKNVEDVIKAVHYDILEIDLNIFNINNELGVEGAKSIGINLEKCQNISYLILDLQYSKIDAEIIKNIGLSLEKCQNITFLDLNLKVNNLGEDGAKNIGISLEKCQNITFLNLNLEKTKIGPDGVKYIGMSIEKCQKISSLKLNLDTNNLGPIGAQNIGASLEKCQNLVTLDISLKDNNIGQEGQQYIGNSLQKCQKMTSLIYDLSQMDRIPEVISILGKCLRKSESIIFLNFNLIQLYNYTYDNVRVMDKIHNLKKMKRLILLQLYSN